MEGAAAVGGGARPGVRVLVEAIEISVEQGHIPAVSGPRAIRCSGYVVGILAAEVNGGLIVG